MGFVLEVDYYGGRKGFLPVTRGVEEFDIQGGLVGKVGMSSSIEVLFEVVGVFEAGLRLWADTLWREDKRVL